jgi:hypothetical protein
MDCPKKQTLLADYQSATVRYAAAVDRLHTQRATSTREEYEALRRATEEERMRSERARLTLEEHVAAHGC